MTRDRQFAGLSTLALAVIVVAPLACAPRAIGTPRIHPSAGHEATAHHPFSDPVRWATVFDSPERDEWQKPDEIVAALGLGAGMVVADIGAGTGYIIARLSRAVGPQGTVLAVDSEPKLVEYLRSRADREGLGNVIPTLAAPDDPRLPAQSVDRLLLLDTYHHIDDRLNYFERLRPALKPDARIVVVDWHKRELPEGPPVDHKLAREQVIEEMRIAGYPLVGETDRLPYQYVLIFASEPR